MGAAVTEDPSGMETQLSYNIPMIPRFLIIFFKKIR